jgi:ABC-type lipoprotein release transport system permease subunit
MTWRLIMGQMRAHRGYFAWTATLLAILVAVLTYTGIAGATQATLAHQGDVALGQNSTRYGNLWVTATPLDGFEAAVTAERLSEMIDSSPTATALATVALSTTPLDEFDPYIWSNEVWAISKYGGPNHDWMLAEGRLPVVRGEIALASNIALRLNAEVGDSVELYASRTGPDGYTAVDVPLRFTVVGITASQRLMGYDIYFVPGALLAWDEIEPGGALNQAFQVPGQQGQQAAAVAIRWDGGAPLLDPYLEFEHAEWRGDFQLPQSTAVWFVVAVVLVIAMIIMSFSVGRSQAAARTQWIATVRTMGATRKYVAAATVLETLVLAAIAAATGMVVGALAAQAQLSIARAVTGAPFGPRTVTLHWSVFPIVGLVALVVALLIAAVPAFWASRVDPVAALKPVNDVTETELSRRVSPHWLWLPLVLGVLLIVIGNWQVNAPMDVVIVLGMIIAGMALIALTIEANRWAIPRVGHVLSRSSEPGRMTAGDALMVRPKQAVAPALLTAAAVTTLTVMVTGSATDPHGMVGFFGYGDFGNSRRDTIEYWWSQLASPSAVIAVVLAALAIQLVAASMFVAHRAATSREGATRRALGLTAHQLTRAHWWQQWAPQATGALVGLAVGLAVAELWRLVNAFIGSEDAWAVPPVLRLLALLAALGAIVIMLLAGALTAWAVSRAGARSTPLGQALRAH